MISALRIFVYALCLIKFLLLTGSFLLLLAQGGGTRCTGVGLLAAATLCVLVGCWRIFYDGYGE